MATFVNRDVQKILHIPALVKEVTLGRGTPGLGAAVAQGGTGDAGKTWTAKSADGRATRLLASELEILEMLWRTKSVTIAEARDGLGGEIGYTTVQTRLNRMVKKGIVRRSRTTPAKYSSRMTPDEVTGHDLDLLLEKVSGGRVVPLVAYLVRGRGLSSAEIAELKRLIRSAEQASRSAERKRGE